MKYHEVKSWVENEGIVSTVQCNRVIAYGQDEPPRPQPVMRRSFSEHDLQHFEYLPEEPAPAPKKKIHVELSPYLDVDFGERKPKEPEVELVPNHIFQYYVKNLYAEGGARGRARARSPAPSRAATIEVKKYKEASTIPPASKLTTIQRSEHGSRKTQSDMGVRFAPGTEDRSKRTRVYTKEKKYNMVDPNVPRHWWQYNHPGKLAENSAEVVPMSPYFGYDQGVQRVIEQRYVADQIDQNPVYAQVERRGVLRNSSQRSSGYTNPPSWVGDYGSNYQSPSEITITGRNTYLVGQ